MYTQILPVFQIFDDDGDGLLSYQEFIAMMKDRIPFCISHIGMVFDLHV